MLLAHFTVLGLREVPPIFQLSTLIDLSFQPLLAVWLLGPPFSYLVVLELLQDPPLLCSLSGPLLL